MYLRAGALSICRMTDYVDGHVVPGAAGYGLRRIAVDVAALVMKPLVEKNKCHEDIETDSHGHRPEGPWFGKVW